MPTVLNGQTAWAVVILALAVACSVLTIAVIWNFAQRRTRLPDATRYEDLKERAATIEVRLREQEELLREVNQKIHDRDRVAAEVAAITERLENLRAEFSSLAGAEQQIGAMKQRAADTAGEFAIEAGKLGEVKLALQEAEARLTQAQERVDRLQKDADALPSEIARLRVTVVELAEQKDALDLAISDLKGVRESLFAARAETAALAARNDTLEARYQELRDTLPGRMNEMKDQLAQLRDERDALGQEIRQQQAARDALVAAREELTALTARREAVLREIEVARRTRDDLLGDKELADAKRKLTDVRGEVATLRAERASLAQMATRAALETEIERLRREASGISGSEPDAATIAADLKQLPGCLRATLSRRHDAQNEDQALIDVEQHLRALDLKYDRRTLHAFHTALKINETSQMTVLAGVSGTGKSLLPRRYAEAMGFRFLQISVEPRWDSPQDLLGFYNYIEKRYRATDLARALVQMDPYDTSRLSSGGHEDEVMLVLLDEMNLARVEYYFSEFLSRLEVRPRMKENESVEGRIGACLSIDIPGRQGEPIRLFPSHNVLFTGTMNDDESTQSLSDKVLDRSNVIQFPAPDEFARPVGGQAPAMLNQTRSFREWQTWIKPTDSLVGDDRDKARRVIDSLAKVMSGCGRPFGHRLNEAILAYVANYPRHPGIPVDRPLADQIELRILPKLRGLPIEDNERSLTDLVKVIREDLRDPGLASALHETLERQRSNNQFNWRGFNRPHG